jgi:hypothetical protein
MPRITSGLAGVVCQLSGMANFFNSRQNESIIDFGKFRETAKTCFCLAERELLNQLDAGLRRYDAVFSNEHTWIAVIGQNGH